MYWWTKARDMFCHVVKLSAPGGQPSSIARSAGKLRPVNPNKKPVTYKRHRFPAEIISQAVQLYFRFGLSYRDLEDMLALRNVTVSYEAIRSWCLKFGGAYAHALRKRRGPTSNVWHVDEVFVKIGGKMHYLWRAVDSRGEVLDILVQSRRDKKAAYKFFRKILKRRGYVPAKLVTDKYVVYRSVKNSLLASAEHVTKRWANNRAENSHQPTRQRERLRRRFRSPGSAQRFLSTHAVVYSHFHPGRNLTSASIYRELRRRRIADWRAVAELEPEA